VLLLREAERKHGVCLRLAEAMLDRRDPDRIQHAMLAMMMSRVFAIACGHEDADPSLRVRTGLRQNATGLAARRS
jgi:Transposase DDE domain group 1